MKLDEIGISKHYIATVFPQRPASGAKWCWGSLEPHSYSAMSSCSCSELLSPSLASGRCWGRSMRAGCQHTFSTHRSLSTTHLFFFFAGLCQTFSKIAPLIWSLLETKQQKNQPSLVLGARIALRGSVTLLEKCWGVTAEGALLMHKEMPALRGQSLPSRSRAEVGASVFCLSMVCVLQHGQTYWKWGWHCPNFSLWL